MKMANLYKWKIVDLSTAIELLGLNPHFGYWKDLLLLAEKHASKTGGEDLQKSDTASNGAALDEAIRIMRRRFQKGLDAVTKYEQAVSSASGSDEVESLKKKGTEISLLAKWLPRENSPFDRKLDFVTRFFQSSTAETSNSIGGSTMAWQSM